MSSIGNESSKSSRRSSELPSTSSGSVSKNLSASTTNNDENFHHIEKSEQDGGDGMNNNPTTSCSSSSSSKPLIWKPPEYPFPEQTIRPSRNSQEINVGSDPEIFAVPTDAEMASLTAKECPILIRPKSGHTSSSSTTNRKRNARTASVLYYTSLEPNFPSNCPSRDFNSSRKQIYQSRRFPQWAWRILSRSLGIKVNPGDSPIIGTILHMATLMFAFMFSVTGAWYIVFDVRSNYTRTTVLVGLVSIVIGFGWVSIGVYANNLAARLISNKNFGENVRMHSRTIFKVSSAGLLFILCLGLVSVNIYHTYIQFNLHPCKQIRINNAICLVNMIGKTGFGFLALIWNCLVGFVLLSVCRTHTIGIRRFIRELETDGQNYEQYWKSRSSLPGTKHVDIDNIQAGSESSEPYVWYDGYQSDDDSSFYGSRNSSSTPKLSIPCQEEDMTISNNGATNLSPNNNGKQNEINIEQITSVRKRLSNSVSSKVEEPLIMSNNDILLSYWKISWRMRVTSLNLQRWLASWIVFIVVWCGNYIIFWMSNKATLPGIVEFILPLLLLLLISSAFAEANAEGQRMIRCICPTEERIFLLLFLNQQPLQMTVFNFALTYNAIVGVVLAFSVAFASKVIMDEVVK